MHTRLRTPGLLAALALLLSACAGGGATGAPAAPAAAQPAAAASPATAAAPAPAAAAGSGPTLPPRPDRPVAPVTIGILDTSSDVVFFYPEEKGCYEHMKIEASFERFDSGGRMISSLATNQIQIGGGSPSVGLYNAMARGVNVKMVADRASASPGYIIFVRKDLAESGGLRDYADLRGKRIALAAKGTTAEVVAGRMLEKGGLTMADADVIEMPYPDMAAAMSTGVLDVGIAPEPSPTVAVGRGVAVKWHTGAEITPQQGSVLMYTGAFIDEQPDVARDFMICFLLGVRAYNDAFVKRIPETRAEVKDIIVRRTSLKDADLLERIDPPNIDPNGALYRVGLTSDYEWFREYGGLAEALDLNQVIDERFAQEAVSVLGPYR